MWGLHVAGVSINPDASTFLMRNSYQIISNITSSFSCWFPMRHRSLWRQDPPSPTLPKGLSFMAHNKAEEIYLMGQVCARCAVVLVLTQQVSIWPAIRSPQLSRGTSRVRCVLILVLVRWDLFHVFVSCSWPNKSTSRAGVLSCINGRAKFHSPVRHVALSISQGRPEVIYYLSLTGSRLCPITVEGNEGWDGVCCVLISYRAFSVPTCFPHPFLLKLDEMKGTSSTWPVPVHAFTS